MRMIKVTIISFFSLSLSLELLMLLLPVAGKVLMVLRMPSHTKLLRPLTRVN